MTSWAVKEATKFAEQLRTNPSSFIASAALEPISEVGHYIYTSKHSHSYGHSYGHSNGYSNDHSYGHFYGQKSDRSTCLAV